jgi:hypothetical protein
MVRVVIESPYAGNVERNLRYVRKCMHDCLMRDEAPFASHALYTQLGVLRDTIPEERRLGIEAGLVWAATADRRVVYTDLEITTGMSIGIDHALRLGQPIDYRNFGHGWDRKL